jgi:hypothetical protein
MEVASPLGMVEFMRLVDGRFGEFPWRVGVTDATLRGVAMMFMPALDRPA